MHLLHNDDHLAGYLDHSIIKRKSDFNTCSRYWYRSSFFNGQKMYAWKACSLSANNLSSFFSFYHGLFPYLTRKDGFDLFRTKYARADFMPECKTHRKLKTMKWIFARRKRGGLKVYSLCTQHRRLSFSHTPATPETFVLYKNMNAY
jgi:hypothetical protein